MLIGEFHHNIDDKKRLVIPTKYRETLGSSVVITRGIEKCLYVYSLENWNKLVKKFETLPFTKKDARTFTRVFFASANDVAFDKSGRIVVTDNHISHASITKECVVLGVNDRLEIWSKELYDSFNLENEDVIEEIAEHLFEVADAL